MNNTKKKDDELPILVLVSGIFTFALLGMDVFYSDWAGMAKEGSILALTIILHALVIGCWYIVLKSWQDPKYDLFRVMLLAFLIGAMISVGLYKALSNEDKMMHEDIEKAKQEQKP